MNTKINKPGENTADLAVQERYGERVRAYTRALGEKLGRDVYVYIKTFGCQQNEADSERLLGTALTLGYKQTDAPENADLIIYNTCAVREHAELRALSGAGELKHYKEKNPHLLVGLWGCMVSQEHRVSDVRNRYPQVDFVAGTNMLHRLPEILCDVTENKRRRYYVDGETENEIVEGVPVKRTSDIKAWLSVMYGCDNFCTYCVVPHVRGRETSRKSADVWREAEALVDAGYREITLLGQNVNSYGKGTGEGVSFAKLLDKTASFDGDYIVRFMTSHPKDVSDELIDVIKNNPKVERHFHLPLQSGSDEILRLMNRHYTLEKYLAVAEKLKKAVPDIALTTDIIVGFPGETEKDFEKTLDVVEKIGFDSLYAFIFSPRKGTPAYDREDTTSAREKTERMARLLSLHREKATALNQGYIGKTVRVLCETCGVPENGDYAGRTSQNKLVRFCSPTETPLYGRFVNVSVEKAGEAQLFGKIKTE